MITRSLSALVLGAVVSGVVLGSASAASPAPVTGPAAAPAPTCGVPLMVAANPDMICLTSPAS